MSNPIESTDVPLLDRLPSEGEEAIHERSVTILADYGISVNHEEARRLLDEAGCTVDEESNLVYIPASLAEEMMAQAPSQFTIRGRENQSDVTFGGEDPVITTAAGPPNMLTFDGGRRSSTMEDFKLFQKLVQQEDTIDTVGHEIVIPTDYDDSVAFVEMQRQALTLTDKIPFASCYGEDRARITAEMVGIVHDDPDLSDHYLFANANSVSPRTWDNKMTGGVIQHAKMGQPVIIAPAVMAGASGPATIAGAMSLANAEILAGITIAQLANPGTPVVYGLATSNTDIRYGTFATGSPEGALFVSLAGQMARYYDVPSRAGGGLTDAKTIGDQSGSEAMLQLFVSMFSGIDFISHGAGILDSYSTASPEKFVLDAERLRYLQRLREGFELTEETFALDLIGEVAPAGHFLNKRHTLEFAQEEFIIPDVAVRTSYDSWAGEGKKSAFRRASDRVDTMLDSYERPAMSGDTKRDIDRFVDDTMAELRSNAK